jgi:hypothetical protein
MDFEIIVHDERIMRDLDIIKFVQINHKDITAIHKKNPNKQYEH